MNRYYLSFLLIITTQLLFGQGFRKLYDLKISDLDIRPYYISDSTIYGSSSDGTDRIHHTYKHNEWKIIDIKNGVFYGSPSSKTYFLTKSAFSIINTRKDSIEKSFAIGINTLPNYFEVFKDSFFLIEINDYMVKFDFNDTGVYKEEILTEKYVRSFFAKLADDSTLFFCNGGSLFRKHLRTDQLTKLPVPFYVSQFTCLNNYLVFPSDNNVGICISNNYGSTFKVISPFNVSRALYINKIELSFINDKKKLITLDLNGNFKREIDIKSILDIPPLSITVKPIWEGDSSWIIYRFYGDVYKVNSFLINQTKFLAGIYPFQLEKLHFNHRGNLVFKETIENLWGTSSDSGKTWNNPENNFLQPIKHLQSVKRVVFIDSIAYLLNEFKLSKFNFKSKNLDTSLYSLNLRINEMTVLDSCSLLLFTNSGTIQFNTQKNNYTFIGPSVPFTNIAFLKKSKRLLAFTGLDIYYSDNYGKSWKKSIVNETKILTSLEILNSSKVLEFNKDTISIRVLLNDTAVVLKSLDAGRTFQIETSNSLLEVELYGYKYLLDQFNRLILTYSNSSTELIDQYINLPIPLGMQSVDSGIYFWDRSQIYYRKIAYQKEIPQAVIPKKEIPQLENFEIFPNPVFSNSVLNIGLPGDKDERITTIELYDLLGKKQEQILFEFDKSKNIHLLKNLPSKSSQIYLLFIITNTGKVYSKNVFIY